jgi:tetratricopeptide (TPR) repeat protein
MRKPGLRQLMNVAACLLVAWGVVSFRAGARQSDFERELHEIDRALAAFAASPPVGEAQSAELGQLHMRRSSMTGEAADLDRARESIDAAVARHGASPSLSYLKASVALKSHRLEDALSALDQSPALARFPDAILLRGDVALQKGRLAEAESRYAEAIALSRTWAGLTRMAHLKDLLGAEAESDSLYEEASGTLTAKEMRAFAWVSLQRGYREFKRGRYAEAESHYARARGAYSGDWMTDDYLAELLAARGDHADALRTYEKLVSRSGRPELRQALGDLHALMGKPEKARPWHDEALAAYLKATEAGDPRYYHHLAGFFTDSRVDGEAAVRWAAKDLALRPGAAAHDTLAWAQYRNRDFSDAFKHAELALKGGARTAHQLYHAGMIALASGKAERGKELLREAAALNPRFEAFHVHR